MSWRKILYSVGIVLGLGLLAQQAWRGYVALQGVQACVVRPEFLLGAAGLYVVAYFVQMAAWALIMRSLHAPLAPQAVVKGYALSFLPRYIPGSVWGYLSRNEWLRQTHGVGYGTSTTASLLEAAMLLVTAAMLGAVYWLPSQRQILREQLILWQVPLVQFCIALVGLVGSLMVWRLLPWVLTKIGRQRIQLDVTQGQRDGLGLWAATCALYVAFWFLQGAALLTIAQTLCTTLQLGLFAATAAFALAWALGFLIVFVPAGLGVREWTLSTLLVTFALLQPGEATLLAVISRFGLIVAEVVVLLVGLQSHIKSWWNQRKWVAKDGTLP